MTSRHIQAPVFRTSNPFATRFIRAGERPFCFAERGGPDCILHRLKHSQWRGQIVGPHGTGKTTLLRTLTPYWTKLERTSVLFELHNGQRRLPRHLHLSPVAATQIIIDGFEQLGLFSQWALVLRSVHSGCGLLVTTHRPVPWLRTIFRTTTNENLAVDLANDLLQQAAARHREIFCNEPPREWRLDRERLTRHFHDCNGNLRDVFLRLYDDYSAG